MKLLTAPLLFSLFFLCWGLTTQTVLAAEPDCTITAPAEVWAESEGNTASVANAGPGARYAWTISNGSITHADANSITWSAGSVSPVAISVTVTGGDCFSCQSSVNVTVKPLPGCDISAPASVNAGSTGNKATAEGGGMGSTYAWTVGNGTITAGAGTSQITWSAGNSSPVTISVTITDGYGHSCRDTVNVTVVPLPNAAFTASPVSGCAPLTVQFTDESTNCPDSWSWNFGDGSTSDARNPSHQYASPGTYTVSLTAANSYGSDTEVKSAFIAALSCSTAVPPSPSSSNGDDFVQKLLTDDPSEHANSWSWAQPCDVMVTNTWANPQTAKAGQSVTIYANMANRGDIQGTYTATLRINGKIEETKSGSLEGNTALPLQFIVSRDRPGTYQVDVNGQETFFTIVDSGSKTMSYLGWIIGIVLLCVFSAVVMVFFRRRHKVFHRI